MQIKSRTASNTPSLSGLHPILARVLSNRGIKQATEVDYSLKSLLPPQSLSQISDAAELLADALVAQANIVIVGDFDADGATSCALAISCLTEFGLPAQCVSYLVPNRFEYGYGLSPEIVGMAAMRQPDIIVTVDNGISSIDGVHAAQALGMTVLVTDHHLPGEQIPTADVIVNPNLPGDRFPSKNLAGVGVIFYIMLAVRTLLRERRWFESAGIAEPNMGQFLDLVALGTVADVVPLDRNNRVLVQQGLKRIRQGLARPGIEALLTVGKRLSAQVASADLGFVVGPRLNAAGRLDDMSVGIECLLSASLETAMPLALQLDELNRERRQVEQSMQQDALNAVQKIVVDEANPPAALVLYDESWHQGVVGLVASRIKERIHRPVVALAPGDAEGEWKGSCRSVDGIHIRDILARVDALNPGLMSKFGGHAMAAGLSIRGSKLAEFEKALLTATEEATKNHDWQQILWCDGELASTDYTIELAEQLAMNQPWGQAFKEPVFEGVFRVENSRQVGDTHLKLTVTPQGSSTPLEAICFGYFDRHADAPTGELRMAYQLSINDFRNQKTLQLLIRHIELGSEQR